MVSFSRLLIRNVCGRGTMGECCEDYSKTMKMKVMHISHAIFRDFSARPHSTKAINDRFQ